jgi:hypothetical protein
MAKRTRDVVGVQRRYRWRLYPVAAQAARLVRHAVMRAELWNALLELNEICHEMRPWVFSQTARGPLIFDLAGDLHEIGIADVMERRRMLRYRPSVHELLRPRPGLAVAIDEIADNMRPYLPSEFDMGYWISRMREECPEWCEVSTWMPRRVAKSMAAAWAAFFRRARAGAGAASGYPRYKSTRRNLAVPHRFKSGCRIDKSAENDSHWTVRLMGVPDAGWHDPKHRLSEGIRAIKRGGLPAPVTEWTDADIILRPDGHWELSAAVVMAPRRTAGSRPIVVKFDLLDGFAIVDHKPVELDGLAQAQAIAERVEAMQRAFDLRYPRGRRLTDDEHEAKREDALAIARGHVKAANARRHALHNWSTALVARASALTIVAPPVREATASARGTARAPGAAVADAAAINKRVLSYAPASAIAMLKYKAAEAGIPCTVIDDPAPKTAIKPALVGATKTLRGINRAMRGLAHGG